MTTENDRIMSVSPSILAEAERLVPDWPMGHERVRHYVELTRPAVAAALQAKQDEIDRLDQLRIDEVSDAQSKAQDIYICAIAENRGLKERIKVLEAALKPFAREAEHWNDIRDQSAPTYPLKGASRLNAQMLRDARTALNPTPASTEEQKGRENEAAK